MSSFFSLAGPNGGEELVGDTETYRPGPPSIYAKGASAISLVLVGLYTFGLPLWSYVLNDVRSTHGVNIYGPGRLCDTNANEVTGTLCGSVGANAASYAELVEKYNLEHREAGNELFVCSCEQGWLGDWICPVGQERYSVSYFIATAPGTGAMAASCAWGITAQWLYGQGSITTWQRVVMGTRAEGKVSKHSWGFRLVTATQFLFQLFFGLFLTFTVCVVRESHTVVVSLFIVFEVLHYITIAIVSWHNAGTETTASKIIIGLASTAVIALAIGLAVPVSGQFGLYAFWLAECTAITAGWAIAPILILLNIHD